MSVQYTVAPRCGVCGLVNTNGQPFCPRCRSDLRVAVPAGYAVPAQSMRPQPAFPAGPFGQPPPQYGYAVPGQPYNRLTNRQAHAVMPHKSHGAASWLVAAGGVIFLIIALTLFGAVVSGGSLPTCFVLCPGPPTTGNALPAPHTYVSRAYGFQVQYYDGNPWLPSELASRIRKVTEDDKSIEWVFDASGLKLPGNAQWPYGFTGESANGRGAQQVVADYQASTFPQATLVYPIPGAGLGVEGGWGGVYDLMARSSTGASVHARLFVIASVKQGTAVVFEGLGPYSPSSQGHPNPSGTLLANFYAPLPNDVVMPGDSPR